MDNKGVLIFICTFIPLFLLNVPAIFSQDVPEDELDVNISTYFDNFRVNVVYPSVKLTKKLGNSTSVYGRYLADIISAASMKSTFQVDGITSATSKKVGGGDNTPDELRNEFGIGLSQKIFAGLFSLASSYSIEHDYSSKTLAVDVSYPFAKKNTELKVGFLGSFDKVFPQIRTWTRDRNTLSFNSALTQILGKYIIAQIDGSYISSRGFQLDGYQVVHIITGDSLHTLEPNEPDVRIRRAVGIRTNFSLSKSNTLLLGYRYYWDTWDVRSHTITTTFNRIFNKNYSISIELRNYIQSRAYFFKPSYTQIEQYMTVDSYLNSGYSNELSLNLTINGSKKFDFPLLNNDKIQFNGTVGFYHRYTDSPDWFSRYMHLYAYLFNIGIRYFL
ncbi:MAG: DUF3570 domain-containing protein [Ignavibacteria bacterium]